MALDEEVQKPGIEEWGIVLVVELVTAVGPLSGDPKPQGGCESGLDVELVMGVIPETPQLIEGPEISTPAFRYETGGSVLDMDRCS